VVGLNAYLALTESPIAPQQQACGAEASALRWLRCQALSAQPFPPPPLFSAAPPQAPTLYEAVSAQQVAHIQEVEQF
jgi:hypothetical protein